MAFFIGASVPTSPAFATFDGISEADKQADVDWPLYELPALPEIARARVFDERFIDLWKQALQRPDVETRRRAVQDIGRAHSLGMKKLDVFVEPMLKLLADDALHPVLVLTIAEALINMDDQDASDTLLKLNRKGSEIGVIRGSTIGKAGGNGGIELVLLTDPALARWQSKAASKVWLERLSAPKTSRPVLISAIESLASSNQIDAVARLRSIAADTKLSDPSLRLHAARALAVLQKSDLVEPAKALLESRLINRLVSATLVSKHAGADAVALLQRMAMDPNSAVANIAVNRLLELDPMLLATLVDQLLRRDDAKLRLAAVRCLAKSQDQSAVQRLLPRLDDHDPAVRRLARLTLVAFCSDEALQLKAQIQSGAMKVLSASKWRGIEQAGILLGRLKHSSAAGQLVKLLDHPRDEVKLASIVALRRLAVKDTLPAILRFASEHTDAWLKDAEARRSNDVIPYRIDQAWDKQLAQLFQLFGMLEYAPAQDLMKRFIPKNSGFWVEARSAAIWALGRIHKDKPNATLVKLFRSRLSDIDPNNPEMLGVRRASAVAIGWMKAKTGIETLRLFYESEGMSKHIGGSCRWAVMRITDEKLPPLKTREVRESGWFITPIEKRSIQR